MNSFDFKPFQQLIEAKIDEYFPFQKSDYEVVTNAARYSLLLGGKRIRPIIMLLFSRFFGGNDDNTLPFAVALEMIHTYSLIHDDLPCMDNDELRRGKPACHIKYGEDIALLAGDTLLTESINVALKSNAPNEYKIEALSVLTKRAGLNGMIGGQVLDLAFETTKPSLDELKTMYSKKTGALLCAAAEIGAILGGASEKEIEIASNYALNLGLAFQIIDDILDITGNELVLGKPIGSDYANNKTTVATLCGLDNAKQIAKDLTDEAIGLLSNLNGNTDQLISLTKFLLNRNY